MFCSDLDGRSAFDWGISITDYTALSLTARLAIGLHCFAEYCAVRELKHADIDDLLDDLWDFPLVIGSPDKFTTWEDDHPHLVNVGLGDAFSDEFQTALCHAEIAPHDFRHLIESLIEIVFSSFYGAARYRESLEFLRNVIAATARFGVTTPQTDLFASSLFVDNHGWGKPISITERDRWRASNDRVFGRAHTRDE